MQLNIIITDMMHVFSKRNDLTLARKCLDIVNFRKKFNANSVMLILYFLYYVFCLSTNSALANSRNFDVKIAIVDVESIFEYSGAIKDIRSKINKISNDIQDEMTSKERELKHIESELILEKGKISEEEFQKRINEFHKKVSDVQKLFQKRKSSLEKAHNEAISAVHRTTISIISDLSKQYNFNLVLPSTQILFVGNELNITPEVISQLNQKLKVIDLKYDPSP